LSRFAIVNPGLLTTFQDLGRRDMLKYALSASGAMDQMALKLVNLLLGNPEGAACLETTMMGLTLRALSPCRIAVGGADLGLVVNGDPAPMWTVLAIEDGDVVSLKKPKSGMRAYVGIAGGFDAPLILGSRSVYLRGSLGAALKRGDEIRAFESKEACRNTGKTLPGKLIPDRNLKKPFHVLPGPQMDYFSQKGIATFTTSTYTVSPVSDRQGIRTDGAPVERVKGPDIITDPTPMGGIQVPGSGMPIILHRDAQVTGGYAKIALLCQADMDRAGQLCPGDMIRFKLISRQEARSFMKKQEQILEEAREVLAA
jgi:antagonist of KipI